MSSRLSQVRPARPIGARSLLHVGALVLLSCGPSVDPKTTVPTSLVDSGPGDASGPADAAAPLSPALVRVRDALGARPLEPLIPRLSPPLQRELETAKAALGTDAKRLSHVKELGQNGIVFAPQASAEGAISHEIAETIRSVLVAVLVAESARAAPSKPEEQRDMAVAEQALWFSVLRAQRNLSGISRVARALPEPEKHGLFPGFTSAVELLERHASVAFPAAAARALTLASGQGLADTLFRSGMFFFDTDRRDLGTLASAESARETLRARAPSREVWLMGLASAYRSEDTALVTELRLAVERALAEAKDDRDRLVGAYLLGQYRSWDSSLSAIRAPRGDVATELARIDGLFEVGRESEAGRLTSELYGRHPEDPRVAIREARRILRTDGLESGMAPAAKKAAAVLAPFERSRELPPAYFELRTGILGIQMLELVRPVLSGAPEAEARVMSFLSLLDNAAAGMRTSKPGRAAALAFVVEQMRDMMPKLRGLTPVKVLGLIAGLLPRVQTLRKNYPNEPDVYRLLIAVSALQSDPARTLLELRETPTLEGPFASEVLLQRAGVLTSVAVASGDAAVLDWTTQRVTDLPAGYASYERDRALMLADLDLAASMRKSDRKSAQRAAHTYEKAMAALPSRMLGRAKNNLAMALLVSQEPDKAGPALNAAVGLPSTRGWVPRLTLLLSSIPEQDAAKRAEYMDKIVKLDAQESPQPSATLSAWDALVSRTVDKARSARAATFAWSELQKLPLKVRGLRSGVELEGRLNVAIGTSSRFDYLLQVEAGYVPWFTHPYPVPVTDLQNMARGR